MTWKTAGWVSLLAVFLLLAVVFTANWIIIGYSKAYLFDDVKF